MIVISTQNFFPDVGGMQAYLTGLADALATRGHDIVVYCDADGIGGSADFDADRRYPIIRFRGPRPWRRHSKARSVSRRIGSGGVDILIADSWKSVELLSTSRLSATKVFCLAHGAELFAKYASAKEHRIKSAFAKSDVVASNSHCTAKLAMRFLPAMTKSLVVLPGVIRPFGSEATWRSPPQRKQKRLLTIARLDPYKGIDIVLQAIGMLRHTHPDLSYDVVGDGQDRHRLPELARELGVADRVTFHGRTSEEKKAALMAAADVFVLPNRSEPGEIEGFGIVFVEAGAFGLPSIAGRDGGTSDAVIDGETGLIVDGEDVSSVQHALDQLLDDPSMAEKMGRAGHARFWSEFEWSQAVGRFEKALEI